MTVRIVERDRVKDKDKEKNGCQGTERRTIGRIIYVAIEVIMNDHISNGGKNE